MAIDAKENILRAICSDKFDGVRLSPSLFTGENTSVSRLALASLEEHWEMFRANVQKPPERLLERIGEINVGCLQELGRNYKIPIELTVEPKPVAWNPAHAEIPQKISRGLMNVILPKLVLHEPPAAR